MNKIRWIVCFLIVSVVMVTAITRYWNQWHAQRIVDTRTVSEEPEVSPEPTAKHAAWNTYHGSNSLTGFADVALPDQLGILWRFKAAAPVYQPPVLSGERVFVATDNGTVIAVDLNGQSIWSKELLTGEENKGTPVRERIDSPMACFEGHLFVGTVRGMVYALDEASGAEKWHVSIDNPIKGSINFLRSDAGAHVYVIGNAQGQLFCLDAASGSILWRSDPIDRCDASPAVSEKAVVFGSCAAALHVFDPKGPALLRSIELGEDSQVAGGVALDGSWVVSGCRSGKVIQADTGTGQTAWVNTDNKSEILTSPAITSEWVVIAGDDGVVYGLDRSTGKLRWKFETEGTPSSPVIASDKVLVAADGKLFLLKLTDGACLWSLEISDEVTSPAIADGMVLVGSSDGTLVALGPPKEQGGNPAS